jgi:hypothetical protein
LILENRIAERYKETFELITTALSNNSFKKEEWYLSVITQYYEIGKFKKIQMERLFPIPLCL